jgi:hypothetical protein
MIARSPLKPEGNPNLPAIPKTVASSGLSPLSDRDGGSPSIVVVLSHWRNISTGDWKFLQSVNPTTTVSGEAEFDFFVMPDLIRHPVVHPCLSNNNSYLVPFRVMDGGEASEPFR